MTYKEAKRKWRKGIRAFKVGDAWIAKDLARMGFSRSRLIEVGAVYYNILKYTAERKLGFACCYEPYFDSYELRFNGWSADGKKYTVYRTVTGVLIRQYQGPLSDIADRVLEDVNRKLREFVLPSVIKKPENVESLYPRMTIHPWSCQSVEQVFGAIIEKGCTT